MVVDPRVNLPYMSSLLRLYPLFECPNFIQDNILVWKYVRKIRNHFAVAWRTQKPVGPNCFFICLISLKISYFISCKN